MTDACEFQMAKEAELQEVGREVEKTGGAECKRFVTSCWNPNSHPVEF